MSVSFFEQLQTHISCSTIFLHKLQNRLLIDALNLDGGAINKESNGTIQNFLNKNSKPEKNSISILLPAIQNFTAQLYFTISKDDAYHFSEAQQPINPQKSQLHQQLLGGLNWNM